MKAVNKTKRQPTEWGKMSVNATDTWLIFQIYKQFMQLYVKKMTQSKSGWWSKWMVLQEDIQMTQKHMKRCLTSLIIREMQIKTIMRYNLPWVRISVKSFSHVWFFVTPWTVAFQDPLSMEFSRQEYWSGLPFSLCAKSVQSCPTLHDPMDCSPPGSSDHGILQARTLEWVAISFFNAWKWKVKVKALSHIWLLATPWTAAHQAPPSIGFSRQEYWSGVPLPSPVLGPRDTVMNKTPLWPCGACTLMRSTVK